MADERKTRFQALLISTLATGFVIIVLLVGLALLQGQDQLKASSRNHGETLNYLKQISNLKTKGVRAIVDGQRVLVTYETQTNADAKAICRALPHCQLPGNP